MRHGSHRTKRTPCAGLVEHHNDQTQQQRGQHEAIKAKAELRHPISDCTGCISPAPWHTECPEQLNGLPQGCSTRSDQIGLERHVAEHRQEKDQKAVTKPLGGHPAGRGLAAGAFSVPPLILQGFVIEHTVAESIEARICNLILKLLTHTFGRLCALSAAGTVSSGALESFPDGIDNLLIGIEPDFHVRNIFLVY